MKYVYFRIFLTEVDIPELLIKTGTLNERLPRNEFLTDVLNRRWEFVHSGKKMIYVPVTRHEEDNVDFSFGRVGKQVVTKENTGPDNEFEAQDHFSWRAANMLTNTASDTNGQKIAFEKKDELGSPLAILSSLSHAINTFSIENDLGWHIEINPMTQSSSFWGVVERYKGQITRAEFSYVTPNVLGIRSTLNQRLKEYKEKENAQGVRVILTDPNGNLNLETQEVRDAVDYTTEGGGSVRLKMGRETIFDSKHEDQIVSRDVDAETAVNLDTPETRQKLVSRFF